MKKRYFVFLLMLIFATKIQSSDSNGPISGQVELTPTQELFKAVTEKNHAALAQLIAAKADVNELNDRNRSLLMIAAKNGDFPSAEQLVGAKADVNAIDEDSPKSALRFAVKYRKPNIVTLLVDTKADLEQEDEDNDTPLNYAAKKGYLNIVKTLALAKANINHQGDFLQSPMLGAVSISDFDVVEFLLNSKADPNLSDYNADTPLTIAAANSKTPLLMLLIESGANINHQAVDSVDGDGYNALMAATQSNYPSAVKFLLENKACVDKKNKSGKTALDIALENQIRFSSEAEQHETITGQKKEITKKQKQNKSIITLLQSYLEDKAPAKKLNKKEGGGSGETVISNGSVKWSFGNSDPFIF